MNKKLIVTIIAILALAASAVSPAFAADTNLIQQETQDTGVLSIVGTHAGNQSLGNWLYLKSITMCFVKAPAVTSGSVTGQLWECTAGTPTSILETSSNFFPVTDFTALTNVTFNFASTTILNASKTYWFGAVIVTSGGMLDVYGTAVGASQYSTDSGSSWSNAVGEVFLIVTTTDTYSAPSFEWSNEGANATLDGVLAFLIPVVIVLLPVGLLAFITRKTDKWIIILGITIGVAMGYYFGLVPVWVVFLVVIGLIGMAYQSVRGGG